MAVSGKPRTGDFQKVTDVSFAFPLVLSGPSFADVTVRGASAAAFLRGRTDIASATLCNFIHKRKSRPGSPALRNLPDAGGVRSGCEPGSWSCRR